MSTEVIKGKGPTYNAVGMNDYEFWESKPYSDREVVANGDAPEGQCWKIQKETSESQTVVVQGRLK